jgi:hypothetical protein
MVIPLNVARQVAKEAELCARREEPIFKAARSPNFSLDALERAMAEAAGFHSAARHEMTSSCSERACRPHGLHTAIFAFEPEAECCCWAYRIQPV